MAKRRPGEKTTVGKILKGLGGIAGVIVPALKPLIEGSGNLGEALSHILQDSTLTYEQKEMLKQHAHQLEVEAFEAEVRDRQSARMREATVVASGGNNHLMNIIGYGITAAFLLVALTGLGVLDIPPGINENYLMFASGSITTAFMAVVSYFFGSSMGSKQKTSMMSTSNQ